MRSIARMISDFVKKADMVLLLLCIVTTIFGIVAISSATAAIGNSRYVTVQTAALILGVGMCMIMVWNLMLPGILVGIVGIVLLLMLIPMCLGLK